MDPLPTWGFHLRGTTLACRIENDLRPIEAAGLGARRDPGVGAGGGGEGAGAAVGGAVGLRGGGVKACRVS